MKPNFPFVEARYTPDLNPAYQGNPYIEHLNPLPDDDELRRRLTRLPVFDESMRTLPPFVRRDLVANIHQLFVPLPRVIRMARTFYRVVRMGYLPRRPYSVPDAEQVARLFRLQESGLGKSSVPYPAASQSNGNLTLSLVGASGGGKSFGLSRISGLFDEVVWHPDFGTWQIPVLFIEMAYDGESIHVLADEIFRALDRKLPDAKYSTLYEGRKGGNAEQRLAKALALCYEHGVGLIIVDEAQASRDLEGPRKNTKKLHSSGIGLATTENDEEARASTLMKLLITASNISHIPMLFSGTLEMKRTTGARFTVLRRLSGNGSEEWHTLQRSGDLAKPDEFEMLLRTLFRYQWLQTPVKPTAALVKVYWDLTQGIPDTMVKLWESVQTLAIDSGRESIDADFLTAAFERNFQSIDVPLRAKRDGNETAQAASPDLFGHAPKGRTKPKAPMAAPTAQDVAVGPEADLRGAATDTGELPDVAKWKSGRLS